MPANMSTYKSPLAREKSPNKRIELQPIVNSIEPIAKSNKLLLKPPKYSYSTKLVPKNPTTSNLIKKLPPPKISPDKTLDKTIIEELSSVDSNLSNGSMAEVEAENKDILSLRNRLRELREKLFENRDEMGSFDFGHNDASTDANEIEIDNNIEDSDDEDEGDGEDEKEEENSELNGDKTIRADMTTSLGGGKSLNETRNKSLVMSDTSLARHLNNLSIESLDLKAKKLIQKSESSLSDKVSTEGLGTSRSTSSTISTISSSNYHIDVQPYRPEFLRFIDNESKNLSGQPLKPEEDILYQWRLRRKMEEAKNTLPPPPQVTFIQQPTQQAQQQQSPPQINKPVQIIDPPRPKQPLHLEQPQQSKLATTNFITSQTQTNAAKVDLATQTSLETAKSLSESISSNNLTKPEIPTRDFQGSSLERDQKQQQKLNNTNQMSIRKASFVSSSPKKSLRTPKSATRDHHHHQSDLTKVSSLISPSSSTSSSTSSLSSSSITNITSRAASPPVYAKFVVNSASTRPIEESNTSMVKFDAKKMGHITSQITTSSSNDNDVFESDEILQMLFKKTAFYQTKLKQIDELLTK